MTHHHHNCCGDGHAGHEEEYDPCMAQEVAQMERDRIRYEKMKVQSDRLLMTLNIRLDKYRVRGPIAPEEHDSCSSDEGECCDVSLQSVLPCEFSDLSSQHRGIKILTLMYPCDAPPEPDALKAQEEELMTAVKAVAHPAGVVASKFSKPICVCGKCTDPQSRASGSLRSLTMILKSNISLVLTRNGGILGMWTPRDGDIGTFIKKHV